MITDNLQTDALYSAAGTSHTCDSPCPSIEIRDRVGAMFHSSRAFSAPSHVILFTSDEISHAKGMYIIPVGWCLKGSILSNGHQANFFFRVP